MCLASLFFCKVRQEAISHYPCVTVASLVDGKFDLSLSNEIPCLSTVSSRLR